MSFKDFLETYDKGELIIINLNTNKIMCFASLSDLASKDYYSKLCSKKVIDVFHGSHFKVPCVFISW